MNRLKELRKEKKLTQKELALELDVHYRTLQNWENDATQIKPDKAKVLANFFGVSVGYLLGYTETNNPNIEEMVLIDENNEIILDVATVEDTDQELVNSFVDFLFSNYIIISDNEIDCILRLILEMNLTNPMTLQGVQFYKLLEDQSYNKIMENISKQGYSILAKQRDDMGD
ncbi:helix-turn-helix transcriptional regulator [Streptococcus danieliae]|nr:helix-turn-helix transcriptional regulator [Streptococcus danieliae]